MEIEVMVFGELAERTGFHSMKMLHLSDTAGVVAEIRRRCPDIESLPFLVAVNKEVIRENTPLKDGDQVVLMPPFSGG
jgi:molybdopterin converting factor small subunit